VLKKIGIKTLFRDLYIRLHIIRKNLDLKIDSLFC